jgi:taurine dioxygenase
VPLANDDVVWLRQLLCDHSVLFFRNQLLSDDQHLALARRFGLIHSATPTGSTGTGDLQVISDTAADPPSADQWHTDHSAFAVPPAMAFLSAQAVPEYGGDTVWASLYGAYEALSPRMREMLEGLEVRHGFGQNYRESIEPAMRRQGLTDGEIVEKFTQLNRIYAVHPLVRPHPLSGRMSLFLCPRYAEYIVDLAPRESGILLEFLHRLLDQAELQVRWHWTVHDFVIWDEAATVHRALPDHFDEHPQFRSMRRCTVAGAATQEAAVE